MIKNINFKKIVIIILHALLVIFMILFILIDKVYLKALTSACFVLTAIMHFDLDNHPKKIFPISVTLGLLSCLLGDIAIEYNFVLGAIGPGIGHILYLIAYFSLVKLKKRDIIFTVILSAISIILITFIPFLRFDNTYLLFVCYTYSIVISFMTCKAINNSIELKNLFALLVCVGSTIFFISDIMVLFNTFNIGSGTVYRNIGHLLYFPAQLILAESIKYYK